MTKDKWYKQLFERLDNSKFRSSFHLKQKDIDYINEKGLDTIRQHAKDFIAKREAPAYIANDGKQTPMKGHPVFIAQHATATCCRECIRKWHKMQPGEEFLWLTQAKMAELFEVQKAAISKHLKNIFTSGELQEEAVVSKMETTAADGKRYNTSYYNLDAIIAVGYRVNSKKATMFRIWANRVLKEFIIKGYVIKSLNLLLFPSVLPIILASSI